MSAAIVIDSVARRYVTGDSTVAALHSVSLEVSQGEFLAIMGASGSGKSTLLHLIAGLDTPSAGSVVIEGRDLARMGDRQRTLFRRRRIGIVFQSYNLLPQLSALENVLLPALLDGRSTAKAEAAARDLLVEVGLEQRLKHRPQAMSGGEQQRVAIARALINDPVMLLADEPTGNLDSHNGESIWRLLSRLVREQGRTILVVTHEANNAAYADRVVILSDGRVAGEFKTDGSPNAADVAARYAELVG